MKILMLVLASVLLTANVFSQENKNQISLSIGPSFTVGAFGDKSTSTDNAGSAGTGADLFLFYEHRYTENLGLGIKLFGNSNKYDVSAIIKDLNSATGNHWTSNNSHWSSGGFLFGLTVHLPSSDKFIIDFRFLGGFISLNSPEVSFSITNVPGTWSKMERASAGSLGYNIGTGFSYFFNPKWNLLVTVDYIGANFKFDDVVTTSSTGSSHHSKDVKQSLGIVNTTIGIGYNF